MRHVPPPTRGHLRFSAALLLLTLGCGGGGGNGNPQVAVTLDASSVAVTTGLRHAFTATVTGTSDTRVEWSVQEPNGGTVDSSGNYTAPATPGEYHVVATSLADTSRSAAVSVSAVNPPSITSFSASSNEVPSGQTVMLTAVFSGGTATVDHGIGAVTSGTPVATGPLAQNQVYVLTVTNAAGTSAVSGVAVVVDGQIAVAVVPPSATVAQGQTLRFSAVVGGALQTGVSWSVAEQGAGSIANDGTYTPPTHGGTFHVVATSNADPSRTARAEVTVPRAWQPVTSLGQVINPIQMVANAGGQAAVIAIAPHDGTSPDELQVGILNGGTWGWSVAATGSFASDISLSSASIGIEDSGAVMVAFLASPSAGVDANPYARRHTAAGWGLPTLLDSTSFRSNKVRLATSPNGWSVVAWDRVTVAATPTYQLLYRDWTPGALAWTGIGQLPADVPSTTDFSGIGAAASSAGEWIGTGPLRWSLPFQSAVGSFATLPAAARGSALGVAAGEVDADYAYAVTNSGLGDGIYVGRVDALGGVQGFGLVPGSAGTTTNSTEVPVLISFDRDATGASLLVYQVHSANENAIVATMRDGNGWSPVVLASDQRRFHSADPALHLSDQGAAAALDGTGRGLIVVSDQRLGGHTTSVEIENGVLVNAQPLPVVPGATFAGFPTLARTPQGMLAVWFGGATGIVSSLYR